MRKNVFLFIVCLAVSFFAGCGTKDRTEISEFVEGATGESNRENNEDTNKEEWGEHFDFYSDEKPSREQLESAAEQFHFWSSDASNITINGMGDILGTEDIRVSSVRDVLTGEIGFYEAAYKTYTKREDGWYDISYRSRLYDPEGNIVIDWTEATYESCVGEWVLTKKYIDFYMADELTDAGGKLLDVGTKAEIENVLFLERLNETIVFVQAKDSRDSFTMDREGNTIYDFSQIKNGMDEDDCLYRYREYVVAQKGVDDVYQLTFYSPEGERIGRIENATDPYIYQSDILSPYVMSCGSVYDLSKGDGGVLDPVFWNAALQYYDGECAVCEAYRDDGSVCYTLYDVKNGNSLSAEYDAIYPSSTESQDGIKAPAAFFIGTRGDQIEKMDRSGKVLEENAVENLCNVSVYDTAIVVDCDDYEQDCLMDFQLRLLIPKNRYIGIYPVYDEQNSTQAGLWCGQYFFGQEQMYIRNDLITEEGEIVMSGCSSIGNIVNGKIPVMRGQSIGLLDVKGNWIFKMPKHELSNDD